jgi:hypothetical protein
MHCNVALSERWYGQDHTLILPSMQVTVLPPTQISLPSSSTAAQGRSRKSEAVPIAFDPHETHPALLHDMVALG